MLTHQQVKSFQTQILSWYTKNKRDLPWRRDRDPYHILVSEVMLQQTQVGRVIPKYEAWLTVFPTLETLAKASTRDVLLHWSGLGYNRRALYLQKFAKAVVEKFDGNVPQNEKLLLSLPGIGKYTARALLCFAFDKQVTVVDTNIRKVILVHFKDVIPDLIRNPADSLSSTKVDKRRNDKASAVIEEIAEKLLPKGRAYDWNQGLMDYAASELKQHKIPIPKQSKFKDSDRFFRGLTIRVLLKKEKLSFQELLSEILQNHTIDKERFKSILIQLEKEKLILKNGNFFTLPESNQ